MYVQDTSCKKITTWPIDLLPGKLYLVSFYVSLLFPTPLLDLRIKNDALCQMLHTYTKHFKGYWNKNNIFLKPSLKWPLSFSRLIMI